MDSGVCNYMILFIIISACTSVFGSHRHEIETVHNWIRGNVTPPASVMMEMGYALALEKEAQTWADTCTFNHDDPYFRFQPGRYHVGQNIYIADNNLSWTEVIHAWESEKGNFTFDTSGNDAAKVSNYTQLVWKDSQLVGCGKKDCGAKVYYVCNYAPGMVQNQFDKPYAKGKSNGEGCKGQYSNTTHALCSCVGKFCVNGGTLNMDTCDCQCVQDVHDYDDHICELNCTQGGDHTDCNTLTFAACRTDLLVPFKCPWMCKICPYGGKFYRENSVRMPWDTTTTSTTTAPSGSTTKAPSGGTTPGSAGGNAKTTPASLNTTAGASVTKSNTAAGNQPGGTGNNMASSIILLWCAFILAVGILPHRN